MQGYLFIGTNQVIMQHISLAKTVPATVPRQNLSITTIRHKRPGHFCKSLLCLQLPPWAVCILVCLSPGQITAALSTVSL